MCFPTNCTDNFLYGNILLSYFQARQLVQMWKSDCASEATPEAMINALEKMDLTQDIMKLIRDNSVCAI